MPTLPSMWQRHLSEPPALPTVTIPLGVLMTNRYQIISNQLMPRNIYTMIQLLHKQCSREFTRSTFRGFLCCWRVNVYIKITHHETKLPSLQPSHYDDVIMSQMASQITSLTIVYSTIYSDADERKHQSSASLAFVKGLHRGPMNSPHKWPVTRKMFPFDDVIMGFQLAVLSCEFLVGYTLNPAYMNIFVNHKVWY